MSFAELSIWLVWTGLILYSELWMRVITAGRDSTWTLVPSSSSGKRNGRVGCADSNVALPANANKRPLLDCYEPVGTDWRCSYIRTRIKSSQRRNGIINRRIGGRKTPDGKRFFPKFLCVREIVFSYRINVSNFDFNSKKKAVFFWLFIAVLLAQLSII